MSVPLAVQAAELASRARADVGSPLSDEFARVHVRLLEPLRVAVTGHVSSGKSTLVNALLHTNVAPTDAGECTKFVTEFRHAKPQSHTHADAEIVLRDGSTLPLALHHGRLPSGQLKVPPERVDLLRVWLANPQLEHLTLIDTPGLNSVHDETSAHSEQLLRGDRDSRHALGGADIVLFVFDAKLTEAQTSLLHEHVSGPGGSPLTVLGILSKADLIGDGADSWARAQRLAGRHAERLASEVATVLPVLGLLAETADTYALNEQHAADLAALAEHGVGAADRALWSADNFYAAAAIPISVDRRRSLVHFLGMYGLKVGIGLAKGGVTDAAGLQQALTELSGLTELRNILADTFTRRADALKASSALRRMEVLSYRGLPADRVALGRLRARIEDMRDDPSMHVVAEFDALHDCRTHVPLAKGLTRELYEDVLRLVDNAAAWQRLGLDSDATTEQLMTAARAGVARWTAFGNSHVGSIEKKTALTIQHSYTLLFEEARRAAAARQAQL